MVPDQLKYLRIRTHPPTPHHTVDHICSFGISGLYVLKTYGIRALKKGGSRSSFATKRDPKCDPPPAEFLVFKHVLKQRLRRYLPRGFILVHATLG